MMLRNLWIVGAGIVCLILGVCAGQSPAAQHSESSTLPAAGVSPIAGEVPSTGIALPDLRVKVTALHHTTLSSQLSGHIALLAVRDGDAFSKGQVLAKMECTVPAAQLRRAEAAVQKFAMLYSTTKKLEQLNSRSQLELSVAKAEAEQAAAEAAVARAMMERCTVLAPFSGRVADRMVQENQFVNEGQPLFEIVDPSALELEFIVPSQWLPWFAPGYAFTVRIDETQSTHEVQLTRLSGKVDAVSQSIKAYAVFVAQDAKLLPGMSGEARITPPAAQGQ